MCAEGAGRVKAPAWLAQVMSSSTIGTMWRALEFNDNTVRFYHSKNAAEMMGFLRECYQA